MSSKIIIVSVVEKIIKNIDNNISDYNISNNRKIIKKNKLLQ